MQTNDTTFTLAIISWIVIVVAIIMASWRRKNGGVGILINYLILMILNHWASALLVVVPNYDSLYPEELIKQGFYQSLIGVIAIGIGSLIIAPLIWKQHDERMRLAQPNPQPKPQKDHNLPIKYFVLGLFAYFVIFPATGYISSIGALSGNMTYLVQTGIILVYWQSVRNGNRRLQVLVLAIALVWPLLTVVTQGFLGFGAWLLLSVFLFVLRTSENPKRLLLPAIIMCYLGLSVIVTYLPLRNEIRNVVWQPSAPTFDARVNIVTDLATEFQFFNITNAEHLALFDLRFPFNFYTGLAIERINDGITEYAAGETITNAFLMVIPRAIWPDKPIRMGGDAVIFQYTGIDFYGSTTVQPPQVMEFYINFGTFGVVVGFIIIGTMFALLDEAIARCLVAENWRIAALLFVPSISLLQAENSLIALIGGSVAGLVTIILVNEFLRIFQRSHDDFKHKETPMRTVHNIPYVNNTGDEISR